MTLPKAARLRRSADVRRVLDHGETVAGPLAALYWYDRTDSRGPRIAVIASRRVGSAVVRNRVRRRIKHVFRQRLDDLPPFRDYVVIARQRAATADAAQLASELALLLARSERKRRTRRHAGGPAERTESS